MKSVTTFVTTKFNEVIYSQYQRVKAVFLPFFIIEGEKGGSYCHQYIDKTLLSLIKRPLFIVVTLLVTKINARRNYYKLFNLFPDRS
jgi:hypothetical protein